MPLKNWKALPEEASAARTADTIRVINSTSPTPSLSPMTVGSCATTAAASAVNRALPRW